MKYEDKERIVAEAWLAVRNDKTWEPMLRNGTLLLSLAHSSHHGYCVITDSSVKRDIEAKYNYLLAVFALPDEEYESWDDLVRIASERKDTSDTLWKANTRSQSERSND